MAEPGLRHSLGKRKVLIPPAGSNPVFSAKINMKKSKPKIDPVKHETEYVEFLRKRLASEHFRQSVSQEEFDKTKTKYDKAKLVLKLLKK